MALFGGPDPPLSSKECAKNWAEPPQYLPQKGVFLAGGGGCGGSRSHLSEGLQGGVFPYFPVGKAWWGYLPEVAGTRKDFWGLRGGFGGFGAGGGVRGVRREKARLGR